ncbi:MAG TPA: TolC family protein, partial [Chthoniobacterales bacterium]|nr:TolC family protein [Chthoniobacterales bacterium]
FLASFLAALIACASQAHAITLEAALARTLEKNPAIQEAKADLEAAAGRRLILRAESLPDSRVLLPGGVQGGKRSGENTVQPFAFARGFFTQPLFDAAIPATRRRGDIEVLLARQRLNVAVMGQLHSARVALYTAAYQDSLRSLGEAQRLRLLGNVRAQADRYQAGQSERGALNVARLLEQEVQPRIEESRRISSGALLRLAATMGDDLGPAAALPTADASLQFAAVQLDLDSSAASALANRPDLKLARLLVRAAAEDQRIIEAAYYPNVNGELSGDYIPVSDIRRGSEGSARRSDDIVSSELRAGGTYTWRVIDNGRVLGAVRRQRAVREMNELVLARLEADVPRELTRIQNNLRSLAARQEALTRAAVVAEQTVADVFNNLSEGRSSQLEYRTAESSFLQTKAGLLSVAFEQNMALAEIDRVTGRYFQFSDDTGAKLH